MFPLAPSFHALVITGLFLFSIIIIVVRNHREIKRFRLYEQIVILCMISIAIGNHGLIHLGVEQNYGFNPYKWLY